MRTIRDVRPSHPCPTNQTNIRTDGSSILRILWVDSSDHHPSRDLLVSYVYQ
jgi:hypothetical protein